MGPQHKSLEQFEKDMKLIQESLRMAYGPWTRKERIMMKLVDVIEGTVEILMFVGIVTGITVLILNGFGLI